MRFDLDCSCSGLNVNRTDKEQAMTAQIIDGKLIAEKVRQQVTEDVAAMASEGRPRPGLATVLVGENPASQVYVSAKQKACGQAGVESFGFKLEATASQEEVENLVKELNADPRG